VFTVLTNMLIVILISSIAKFAQWRCGCGEGMVESCCAQCAAAIVQL
jgi:hypothetical protein